ncbi:MAG: XrtA/PEP-CTERM system histidine kinase PrsK [Geobacteraceae bacterium]|nr:XrtA/PEP-CTERM system histidine kinase PrsK [Geobacteraceae bacterium]
MIQTILSSFAIAFAVVYIVSIFTRIDRILPSLLLALAMADLALLEFFDLQTLLNPDGFMYWKEYALLAEGFFPFIWLFGITAYAHRGLPGGVSRVQKILVALSVFMPVAALAGLRKPFFYSPDFAAERMLFLNGISFAFYVAMLAFLVVGLVNLESTLRNASREVRWRIKFEVLGAAALLGVMIFYYSQGLLYRSINMNLVPVRSVVFIAGAGMMAFSRFWRKSGSWLYISQQMAFRSVVLLIIGLYLVGVGLMGEGMRYFGDSFQHNLMIALAILAGVGLMLVLLSETVKRKMRVYLHKNFYRQKYDYRTQWLQFTDGLAAARSRDDLLRAVISGFCEIFGMGCGALYLNDGDRASYQNVAVLQMDFSPLLFSGDDDLLQLISQRKWVIHIAEDMPSTNGPQSEYFHRFSIIFAVPLFHDDRLEGFILLGRPFNKDEAYYYEDYDLMKTLARQASSAVLNLRLTDELSRAREMEAVGRISAFVLHDLKNLVSALAMVVDNAREHIDNPEFRKDMFQSLEGTVDKMKGLIAKLKKLNEKPSLQLQSADLLELASATAEMVNAEEITVSGEAAYAEIDREEMRKLLLNLMLNAVEASGDKPGVSVIVGTDTMVYVRVIDKGCGMTQDFIRNDLFKPFRTTKSKGLGIGLYQCRQIAEAHGGKIEVASEAGKGSVFTVRLPKVDSGPVEQ